MKRTIGMTLSVCGLSCSVIFAQPPGGREGRPPRDGESRNAGPRDEGPRSEGPRGAGPRQSPPYNPLMEALDPDNDHVISAEEIKSAMTALLKLDKNRDGKLTEDEFRLLHPGENVQSPSHDEGGRFLGRPPRDEGDRPREGGPRDGGRRDAGPRDSGPRDGGPREGGPRDAGPRDAGPRERREGPARGGDFGPDRSPEGRGPDRLGGPQQPGGFGGPGGPPDPVQFVEHIMEFDANGDGLLSKEELMQFAERGMRRGGPAGGAGRPGNRDDQPRPARPSRPE